MRKMTSQNLENIRLRFQEATGTDLNRRTRGALPGRRLWVLAAAVICSFAMLALSYPLFSSLDGDELSLSGTYEGNGVVCVRVENRSGKPLRFQKQTRLMRWVTGEEIPRLSGEPLFQNVEFSPHSEGVMTIDLSRVYDMKALEESATNSEWFYLVLTNNDFLFGQDWMCSVCFLQEPEQDSNRQNTSSVPADRDILLEIREELRFYFETSYTDVPLAFNEANFQYQQKVDELLTRFDGKIVPALAPVLMVGGPSEFLDPEPVMGRIPEGVMFDPGLPESEQHLLTRQEWGYTDALGRMVASVTEKAWIRHALLPQSPEQNDGGVSLPLVFLFVYDAEQALPENYAFLYGRILSFEELEKYRVLSDEHYAVYDATDMIYEDVDAYLDAFLTARPDVYCDDTVRNRVHNILKYYRNPENIRDLYGYLQLPE